ncbi:MAG TPA: polysaccharide biosynthesis tyrosine autokinase [Candidatus Aminicenantes bacterium]|nr:polysaccharide biosynthesis tyrosine autokinase [Candidatus Aminicenantes bacterium]HRY64454.1 polysaccharide biosynthesis tyrosine autokinase [Candidatus Aminicenantes bacterium]HRZ71367.1 polysaccharide biosynthesis tyrosine autokinase [Candidatus Aminicenantes bacterium]
MKGFSSKTDRREVDLLEYVRIVLKRKWVLAVFTAVLVALAAVLSFTRTPLYRATATLLIDEPGASLLNIQDVLNAGGYYRSDYLGTYFNTQLRLLTSRSLAERVAKRLNLAARPELRAAGGPRAGFLAGLKSAITFRWLSGRGRNAAAPPAPSAGGPSAAGYASVVQGGLSIAPIAETRLVYVSYVSPHAVLAADIVNAVVEEFVSFSVESRYEATKQTSEFLTEQTAQLREDLKRKEEDLQKYGQEKNLLYLSDNESTVVNKFADVNTALTTAQIERYAKESAYLELKNLDVDSLPESVSNPTIQALRTTYTQVRSDYEEKGRIYRPEYPEMVQLKARLDATRNTLQEEIRKAVEAAESEYRAALKKENSLRGLLDEQRGDVTRMNKNAIFYHTLRTEVENMRTLLSTLVAKQNEIQVSSQLGGLRTSNIKVVDRALVPPGPFTPNVRRNLLMALLAGLFGGLGLVFLIEYLDNTVKGPEDVEKLVGLPSLGVIPFLSAETARGKSDVYGARRTYGAEEGPAPEAGPPAVREIELINHLYPKFSIAEDYRTVRTSILFSHADGSPKTIAFTSTLPQEGKTATVSNLAVSFAQLEGRVLLIDADLRKPRLSKVFALRNAVGLSGYLAGKNSFDEVVQKTSIENVWTVPSGPHPPNPAELLNSRRMKELLAQAKEEFGVVLLDTPPVLAVIDPVIVSSLADSTVFVVRAGKTTRRSLQRAVEEVRRSKADIIGVVFNEVRVGRQGIGTPFYHYYEYEYESSEAKAAGQASENGAAAKGGAPGRS